MELRVRKKEQQKYSEPIWDKRPATLVSRHPRVWNLHHASPPLDPRSRRANWMSLCMIVTRFAWIAHRFLRTGSVSTSRHDASETWAAGLYSRVFEHVDEKCFGRLLQRENRRCLPPQAVVPIFHRICHHVQRDLAHLQTETVVSTAIFLDYSQGPDPAPQCDCRRQARGMIGLRDGDRNRNVQDGRIITHDA